MVDKLGMFVPKNIESIAKPAAEINVVKASSVLPSLPKTRITMLTEKPIYTNPFAPTGKVGDQGAEKVSKHIDIFA